MTKMFFNLLDEPWIIVTNMQGKEEILSLTDTLTRSHELKSLSGEMPTQDIAILRLLLGVLYAIYTRTGEYEEAQDEGSQDMCVEIWRKMWESGHFPQGDIEGYLKTYHDRFWLIHPERPFYQVAEIKKGSDFAAAKMIGELVEGGNKLQLFPMRSGESKRFLNYPEATRWLLYLNSFDDAAAKPSIKGAGLGIMSVGWLGVLDLVHLSGESLFETLMFNLSLLNEGEPWSSGKATWELENARTSERTAVPMPESAAELYTLQSRRIHLKWQNDKLIGFTLLGGDQFSKDEAFVEPMTQWRKRKGEKGQSDKFVPPSNEARDPAKQMWRDFAPLFMSSHKSSDSYRRPGILNWISALENENIISSKQIQICTMSIKYGNMQSGIEDVWSDSLSVNASLLSTMNALWITRIVNMVGLTENLVKALGSFAINIAKSAGASDSKSYSTISTEAREHAYSSLDIPFRKWIASINPKTDDEDETCNAWAIIAKSIVLGHGENIVTQASEQAFVGRTIVENKKEIYYSAPKAYGWFKSKVYKELAEKTTIMGVIKDVKENA